jgi:hypothetical protein
MNVSHDVVADRLMRTQRPGLPFCRDCMHCINPRDSEPRCSARDGSSRLDLVSGEAIVTYPLCADERSVDFYSVRYHNGARCVTRRGGNCCREGRFFVPAEEAASGDVVG